jgi:Meiotically Up-regulated Gene 113 (MUG113) protein
MKRDFIIAEIKRTAAANGGTSLGRQRFAGETGIKQSDWYGNHWATWGAALQAAGFSPNKKQEKLGDEMLLEKFAGLIHELGRFPVAAELRMKARADHTFPSHNTFRRFGGRAQLAARLVSYSESVGDRQDVLSICQPIAFESDSEEETDDISSPQELGSVYLIKAGRYYKIGRSNSAGRREYEIAIQLPEKPKTVHVIRTDDPVGIEAYWHNRFADKRKNGEWFQLTQADVQAFRRRKFM